ncbi:MAG: hypothetical protein WDO13_19120 [Verrucomicrobiota bacterium]
MARCRPTWRRPKWPITRRPAPGIVDPATATLNFSTGGGNTYQEPTALHGLTPPAQPTGGVGITEVSDRSGFFLGSVVAGDTTVSAVYGSPSTTDQAFLRATVGSPTGASANPSVVVQYELGATWYTYENPASMDGSGDWFAMANAGAGGVSDTPGFAGTSAGSYYGAIASGPDRSAHLRGPES